MPKESTITAAIKRRAEGLGWWVMKIHGGPMQLSGVPDLLCLQHGHAVFLEVKQPGKKPTPLQMRRMDEIKSKGGAPCHVVTSADEAHEALFLAMADIVADRLQACCRPRCRRGTESR